MELKEYFLVVKKWWWLMIAAALVAGGASYYAVSRTPRIYQATTTIMLGEQSSLIESQSQINTRSLAALVLSLATRRTILEGAAESIGLPYVPSPANVSAGTAEGTPFLEISVRDTNPERARVLADAIAAQLIIYVTESRDPQSHNAFTEEQLQKVKKDIETTEAEIDAKKVKLSEATSARAIRELEDDIDALQQIHRELQSTYTELVGTLRQEQTEYMTVFEPAYTPTRPISPRVMETVLLAAAIGLALAIAGAFLIEFLDDTIKTPEDAARAASVTAFAAIANIGGRNQQDRLIPVQQPRSPIAEAYRTLRTNIQVSSVDEPIRTLVVTSANPREGKTTTAANLGVVMAQAGKSVIMVDADLRRSALHRLFDLSNQEGLTDVLLQEEPMLDGFLQETKIDNLRVLTSGPLPPNPSELLGSKKMRQLIEQCKSKADIVIFDTPPILPVTDAAVLSIQTDGVLLISQAGRTRRASAKAAVENLRQVGANVVGIALNRLSHRQLKGHYYYYAEDAKGRLPQRKRPWYQRIPLVGNLLSR
jgi:succinoglycan biosynthesis transport protein ExoP